jgi:hypothetical protein
LLWRIPRALVCADAAVLACAGRRLLSAPASPPPRATEPDASATPPPPPPPWVSSDARCAASNFPVLFDAAALDALKAAQNGTVTPNVRMRAAPTRLRASLVFCAC